MATIVFVSEFDCGGRNQVWCDVINDLTEHKAYNAIYHTTTLKYGHDAIAGGEDSLRIADEADIIVACPGLDHGQRGPGLCRDPKSPPITYDGPFLTLPDGRRWADLGKPLVIWLWGSLNLRAHYGAFHAAFDAMGPVWCADCDVAIEGGFRMAPMPNYYPWLTGHWPDAWPLWIVHTVTDRAIKDTDAIERAFGASRPNIILDLINGEPLKGSLWRKSKAHVNIDHLQGYFGNSSFEATMMGLPNIVRLAKPKYKDAIKDAWQSDTIPPWHLCNDIPEARAVVQLFLEDDCAWQDSAVAHYGWHQEHFRPAEFVDRLFVRAQ